MSSGPDYPPWGEFDIIGSERFIVDPENEARCPSTPKITLVDGWSFDEAINATWDQCGVNEWEEHANAWNVQRLLCQTLPLAHLCPYHLGRGMAAVALEVVGYPRNEYRPLIVPMRSLLERVPVKDTPRGDIAVSQDWFEKFMRELETDGAQGFLALAQKTEPVGRKKARRW